MTRAQMIQWKVDNLGFSYERAEFEYEEMLACADHNEDRLRELAIQHPDWLGATYED